jgi:acetyl esterase
MTRQVVLSFLCALLSCSAAFAAAAQYTVIQDVEFTQHPVSLRLDAHVPPGQGPFPAVILVHGGGWTAGNKTANFVLPLFEPLTKTGYTWFTIDYRLAPQYPYPAAVEDVQSAITFVKQHAGEYKVDVNRIALMGESAGAHLVNLVGARNQPPYDVAAVVSFYGPIDMLEFCKKFEEKPATGGLQSFFQITEWNDAAMAKIREASPATYLSSKTPPFLFIQGTEDEAVPYAQATLAVELFKKHGIPCQLITVQGGIHGVINWEKDPKFQGYKTEMIDWLHGPFGGIHGREVQRVSPIRP